MTIYVLMPVHNRVTFTQTMLNCLRSQILDDSLSIVVVDDGSTDGTSDFLDSQNDLKVLKGDGSLWWGGAINLALQHVLKCANESDWVLLVNNDTKIENGFVQKLLETARSYAPAAVGSVILDMDPPHRLLSIGPKINPWRLSVNDIHEVMSKFPIKEVLPVDALSGRGALYPISILKHVGGMRPRLIPHYLADYELALRVKSLGCKLLVNTNAGVYSLDEYGNGYRASSFWERLFSIRSPSFFPAHIGFWWSASTPFQRLTFPLRVVLIKMMSLLRTKS